MDLIRILNAPWFESSYGCLWDEYFDPFSQLSDKFNGYRILQLALIENGITAIPNIDRYSKRNLHVNSCHKITQNTSRTVKNAHPYPLACQVATLRSVGANRD